jgi:hypothetical protein
VLLLNECFIVIVAVVDFVIDSVRKLLDISSYADTRLGVIGLSIHILLMSIFLSVFVITVCTVQWHDHFHGLDLPVTNISHEDKHLRY